MKSKLKIDTRVRSLKAYLEEFELGKIQIPSFQRDFLWSQDQIIQLFDSIKNNYPIGSIQFWKPLENASEWIAKSSIGPYGIKSVNKPEEPIYILDGFQRLSSLFGCLTNPLKYNKANLELDQDSWNKTFNLYYDLEVEEFIYSRFDPINSHKFYQVPVYVFLNSVDFRQYSRKYFDQIEDETKVELYLDRADELGQVFTNYQIASVDINYASIEEAVKIFWRVNATGVPISKDWIVSALTNRGSFRLGSEIDKLMEELKPYEFNKLKRDVIFKCIQSSFGKIYFDYKIEELVEREDFEEITIKTIKSIRRSVEFLYENLLVLDSKLLPYNGQLIFITTFFNSIGNKKLTNHQIFTLKRWFWVSSYSNYFTMYSLSNQRKAFDKFNAFVENEKIDPVYNDRDDNLRFSAQDFPSKIYMGSVRSKTLALYMINHFMGMDSISLKKRDVNKIEAFEMDNLFSKPRKENPAENFVPIIHEVHEKDGKLMIKSISKIKKPQNYSFLLREENDYENLFITQKMKDIYDSTEESEEKVLSLRKEMIIEAERKFVESLDINY